MTIPIEQFTISRSTTKNMCYLVAERSDFGPIGTTICHQLYPDAADIGITVVGKTGSVDYYVHKDHFDEESDLISTSLLPTPESLRKVPGAKNTEVILFND
jgi:hypothetical protein